MTKPDFRHSILARLDATIKQFEDNLQEFKDKPTDSSEMRRSNFILLQIRREILNVREAAQDTLTQLNTFGATLEVMSKPEDGVDAVIGEVMRWFMLLSQCERGILALYDKDADSFEIKINENWHEVRPMEEAVSEHVMKAVKKSPNVLSSSNVDLASASYQKSGSWRVPLRTVLGIPLVWGEDFVGVFYGDKKITSGVVSQDMNPLFKLYGAQVAIAIRNAQRFAELTQDQSDS